MDTTTTVKKGSRERRIENNHRLSDEIIVWSLISFCVLAFGRTIISLIPDPFAIIHSPRHHSSLLIYK
jgi:hypothetical protein